MGRGPCKCPPSPRPDRPYHARTSPPLPARTGWCCRTRCSRGSCRLRHDLEPRRKAPAGPAPASISLQRCQQRCEDALPRSVTHRSDRTVWRWAPRHLSTRPRIRSDVEQAYSIAPPFVPTRASSARPHPWQIQTRPLCGPWRWPLPARCSLSPGRRKFGISSRYGGQRGGLSSVYPPLLWFPRI